MAKQLYYVVCDSVPGMCYAYPGRKLAIRGCISWAKAIARQRREEASSVDVYGETESPCECEDGYYVICGACPLDNDGELYPYVITREV